MAQSVSPRAHFGGQVPIDQLLHPGAECVYSLSVGNYLEILNALDGARDRSTIYNALHEAGAEAFGKLTGKPVVSMVTLGSGASHAAIVVHIQVSTSMNMLNGQADRPMENREAFQGIDYCHVFGSAAKWAAQGDDATPYTATDPNIGEHDLTRIRASLSLAQRPILLIGGHGRDDEACRAITAFAETHDLPVACSFRRQHTVNNHSDVYIGDFGIAAAPKRVSHALVKRQWELAELKRKPRKATCQTYLDDVDTSDEVSPMDIGQSLINIRDQMTADTIVTFGADNHIGWAQRYLRYGRAACQLCSTNGATGYSLHNPERVVLACVGDSDFMTSGQEQTTPIQYGGLPNVLTLQHRYVRHHLNAPRARTSQTRCRYRAGQFRFPGHDPCPEGPSRSHRSHRRARLCSNPRHPGLVAHSDRAINRYRTHPDANSNHPTPSRQARLIFMSLIVSPAGARHA